MASGEKKKCSASNQVHTHNMYC